MGGGWMRCTARWMGLAVVLSGCSLPSMLSEPIVLPNTGTCASAARWFDHPERTWLERRSALSELGKAPVKWQVEVMDISSTGLFAKRVMLSCKDRVGMFPDITLDTRDKTLLGVLKAKGIVWIEGTVDGYDERRGFSMDDPKASR